MWPSFSSVQFSHSVMSDSLWPFDYRMPGLPVHHKLPEFTQPHVHWVGDAIQPPHPLLSPSPPSIFPSIRVFSNESVLHIRWLKYWSFSLSISPSNEYLGLISFRMDCLYLLAVQGALKSFLQHHSSKPQFFGSQLSLLSNSHIHTWLLEKPYLNGTKTFFHFMPRKECLPPLSFWVCQRSLQPHCF